MKDSKYNLSVLIDTFNSDVTVNGIEVKALPTQEQVEIIKYALDKLQDQRLNSIILHCITVNQGKSTYLGCTSCVEQDPIVEYNLTI